MLTVHFHGQVLPRPAQISVSNIPLVSWTVPEHDLELHYTLTIKQSVVHVIVTANKFDTKEHLVALYMRALDLTRSAVDLIGFVKGMGLVVHLDRFVDSDGKSMELVFNDESLVPLCTAYQIDDGFSEMLSILLASHPIAAQLRNLIESITIPHVSLVNCARAVEGLRQIMAPAESNDSSAWKLMRDALNVDEAYLKLITGKSKGPRHGGTSHVPGTVTSEVTKRAWNVMNRFLEYKKRNDTPLPQSEFPMLLG